MPDLFDTVGIPSQTEAPQRGDIFDQVAQFLPRSGAQMDVEEARQARDIAQPFIENPQVGGVVTELNRAVPRSFGDLVRMAILPREGDVDEQNLRDEDWRKRVSGEYGPVEQAAALTGTAMQALPLLHVLPTEGVPPPLRVEPLVPEPPPTQSMGPGTTAADVSNALDWTPQSAPVTPLEETVAKVQPPGPYVSPETGFTHYPGLGEGHAPVPSEWAYPRQVLAKRQAILDRIAELQTQSGAEAELAQLHAQLNNRGTNPIVHAPPPEGPVPASGGATSEALPPGGVPVAETPAEPYTPEAAAQRAAQPQTAAPPTVASNVKGFEEIHGAGEIPAGATITPEDAWDNAVLRAVTGKAQPYGFVDRARTGAITDQEMGDLIYEHHRLVERAALVEGRPEYNAAANAAKDFATNVLKPAESAWHRKGMTMQIKRPLTFETQTGMNAAAERMKVEIKANEVSEAKRHVRDNAKASKGVKETEGELLKAMDREYSKGAKRPPKTAEQLRTQLAETEPCVL